MHTYFVHACILHFVFTKLVIDPKFTKLNLKVYIYYMKSDTYYIGCRYPTLPLHLPIKVININYSNLNHGMYNVHVLLYICTCML